MPLLSDSDSSEPVDLLADPVDLFLIAAPPVVAPGAAPARYVGGFWSPPTVFRPGAPTVLSPVDVPLPSREIVPVDLGTPSETVMLPFLTRPKPEYFGGPAVIQRRIVPTVPAAPAAPTAPRTNLLARILALFVPRPLA